MTREEIQAKVIQIIVEKMGIEESKVKPEAEFVKDLGLDSLDVVEVIMEFEEAFDITIPDKDAEAILTVADTIEKLNTLIK